MLVVMLAGNDPFPAGSNACADNPFAGRAALSTAGNDGSTAAFYSSYDYGESLFYWC